jgi:mannose-1-phosphate guanylyltransferase
VLVFNGDILSGVDLAALVDAHQRLAADVTLHLTRVDDPRAFGLVPTGLDGRVLSFLEKPQTSEEIVTDQINAGCYVFTRSVIDTIPTGRPISVERETFPDLLRTGAPVFGVVDDSYWLDLGTPASFVRGSADLVRGLLTSSAMPGPVGEALVLPGASVAAGAVLSGGATVSQGVFVGEGAVVEGSILLPGARIESEAVVRDSVVGAGAVIGARTWIEGAAVGDHARVGSDNELPAGSRIACGAVLPDAALRVSAGVMACLPHGGAA